MVPLIIPVTINMIETDSPDETTCLELEESTKRKYIPRIFPKLKTTEEPEIEMVNEITTEHKVDASLLDKVIGDVKQLIQYEQEDRASAPESALCNVTGNL